MRTIIVLWSIVLALPTYASPADTDTIVYHFQPHPAKDKFTIAVRVDYRSNSPQLIGPLQDFYGTPDLAKCVQNLLPGPGCRVDTSGGRTIIYPSAAQISFRYEVVLDSAILEKYSFAPAVGSYFFHLSGCQWMLPVGSDTMQHIYQFSFGALQKDWHYYSSANRRLTDFYWKGNYERAGMLVIGGSQYAPYVFHVLGKPVEVFLDNNALRKDSSTFLRTEKIFRTLRGWFNDTSQSFFIVPILQRDGIVAGNALDHMFRCFVKPTVHEEELLLLLAHELFHQWLPGAIDLAVPTGETGMKYEWFSEGFTDYLSWKILKEAGILSQAGFVRQLNRAISNYEDDPYKTKTLPELIAIARSGVGGSALKKLSYYRGALIALQWDEKILQQHKGKRSLNDFIRDLYQLVVSKEFAPLPETSFYSFARGFGIEADSSFAQHILRGENIVLPQRITGGFIKKIVKVPAFHLGFDASASFRTRAITGVETGSNAWKAGLRNGQIFTRVENTSRFINGWRLDEPVKIILAINNQERVIKYYPVGTLRPQARYVQP